MNLTISTMFSSFSDFFFAFHALSVYNIYKFTKQKGKKRLARGNTLFIIHYVLPNVAYLIRLIFQLIFVEYNLLNSTNTRRILDWINYRTIDYLSDRDNFISFSIS